MKLIDKIVSTFRRKDASSEIVTLSQLSRLIAPSMSPTEMLRKYEKSLYVFACVSAIADSVSKTRIKLMQVLNTRGDVKELAMHDLLSLLYKPNPFETHAEFFKITMINKLLCGDAFWYIVRDKGGRPAELWNLRPDLVEIVTSPTQFVLGYRFTKEDGVVSMIDARDVVHFKSPSPLSPYLGTSALKSAAVRVETENFASEYQRNFFLNSARPDGLLISKYELRAGQTSEVREQFEKQHRGAGKNSKIAVLGGDLTYEQLSITQKEMDFIESMKFTRDDILVAFHVPKPIVAITDDVNLANAQTAREIFLGETVKPEAEYLAEKVSETLVPAEWSDSLYLESVDPTPENREQLMTEYQNGISNGWLLINEVRARENLPPIDGGWNLYRPITDMPVGGLSDQMKQLIFEARVAKAEADRCARVAKIFTARPALYARMMNIEKHIASERKSIMRMASRNRNTASRLRAPAAKEERKILKPLIQSAEGKAAHAEAVNKAVDQRAMQLKQELIRAEGQRKDKLLNELRGRDFTKTASGFRRKAIGKDTKKFLDSFFEEDGSFLAEFVLPYLTQYAREAGLSAAQLVNPAAGFELTQRIQKVLQSRASQFGLGVSATTRDKITAVIEAGIEQGQGAHEISDAITGVYDEFPTWRADMIARTESTAATQEGTMEGYKQSEVVKGKEWVNAHDARVRPEHQNQPVGVGGEVVGLDEVFSNGLAYPQEPNCRCVLAPAIEG